MSQWAAVAGPDDEQRVRRSRRGESSRRHREVRNHDSRDLKIGGQVGGGAQPYLRAVSGACVGEDKVSAVLPG